jgi:3-dehydroquinate synthetase
MTDDDETKLRHLLMHMGPLPPIADLRTSEALDAVKLDKKVVGGRLHFVLAQGIGATVIAPDVTAKELTIAMKAIGMRR